MSDEKRGKHTVEKIGGTSIAATSAVMDNVLMGGRKGEALYNRIFIVSAYAGVTDRLIEHKKTGEPGVYALFAGSESEWAWSDAISRVADEMHRINAEVFGDRAERRLADAFVTERIEGARNCLVDLNRLCSYGHFRIDEHLHTMREMLAALGEAHSAHNTALLLKQHGVNALFIDLTGWRDDTQPSLDERLQNGLADIDFDAELAIVTGYAQCNDGIMSCFGRGYTEVTFSRIAALTGAREAVIHKEFHLSSADPKLVGSDRIRTIGRTNYDVADQLSNLGMEAIHPRAAKGLRQANIPLRVKNTFDPHDLGTLIRADYASETPRAEIVTGMKGVYALEFFEQDMVGVKGYDVAILDALKRHNARIITKASNANTIIHYVAGSRNAVQRVLAELQEAFPSSDITTRKVAIVSAIGSDMSLKGLTAKAVSALADAGIELLGVHQLMRNVDILFILEDNQFDGAIRALHAALIEDDGSQGAWRGAASRAA